MTDLTQRPNQRVETRLLLGNKALFYTNKIEGTCLVADLSKTGVFLTTRAKLRCGHEVRLIVFLGNCRRHELFGRVVREDSAGFALRFRDPDDTLPISSFAPPPVASHFDFFDFVGGCILPKVRAYRQGVFAHE